MKSQLILSILTIVLIGFVHAESPGSEENDPCFDQWMNLTRNESACFHATFNETELFIAVNKTLIEYSGDDDAVRAQTNKFCPILSNVLECTLIGFDLDKDCITPVDIATKRLSYDISRNILNYLCGNNSEVILQILQNDGLDIILENRKHKECLRLVDGIQNINEETLSASTEFCDGMDKVFACYANMVRDHKNQNLVRIAGEIKDLLRQTIKCPPATQL